MKNKQSTKKIVLSGIFFLALIFLTFYVILKDINIKTVLETLATVKIGYVILGGLCGFTFVCCEGINIGRTLKHLQVPCSFWQGMKYGFIGFFFSSVTPSASGGQPMQLYYMIRDKIELSHGSLALLLELASYQVISVFLAIAAFLFNIQFFQSMNKMLILFLCLGVFLNLCVLVFLLLALFSKKLMSRMVHFLFMILKKCSIKNAAIWQEKVELQLIEYREGAIYIKENPKFMGKVLATTLVQFIALHSIPFCIYLAFDLSGHSYFTIFSMQAVLYIAVSALPLPGAVGITEGVFLSLFSTLYPGMILSSALLLSRLDSFYFIVLFSGVVVLVNHVRLGVKRKREYHEKDNLNCGR